MPKPKNKESRGLKKSQHEVTSDAKVKESKKTHKREVSLPEEGQQLNKSVDFYSSIFADASSEEDDGLQKSTSVTTSENSTKVKSKLIQLKHSDSGSKSKRSLEQKPSNSLGNKKISKTSGATKPSSASFIPEPIVQSKGSKLNTNNMPQRCDGSKMKMVKTAKSHIQTTKRGLPMLVESSSESDENDEFVYDDGDESDDKDEDSEPEVIGVGVRSNKGTSLQPEEEVEIKEEAISMSDEDIETPNSEKGDSDSEEEERMEKDESFEDSSRTAIREELANLTYEELEELKNKLGTKEYYEAMFGKGDHKPTQRKKKIVYKRDNKNRPRELPVRLHVPKVREVIHVKKVTRRDPRFEDSCGDLNEQIWEKNYDFLKDIQKEEAQQLQKSLKTEEDADRRKEIRKYLQTVRNKEASKVEKEKQMQKRRQEKEENIKRLKEGKNPFYLKKSTRKVMDLAEKYEELKATGKLEKYLKKKRKKNQGRDKKALKLVKPKS